MTATLNQLEVMKRVGKAHFLLLGSRHVAMGLDGMTTAYTIQVSWRPCKSWGNSKDVTIHIFQQALANSTAHL